MVVLYCTVQYCTVLYCTVLYSAWWSEAAHVTLVEDGERSGGEVVHVMASSQVISASQLPLC